MGLFDNISAKSARLRQEKLKLVAEQANEERNRLIHDLAVIKARRVAAQKWLETNRPTIVNSYNKLLEDFFAVDSRAVLRTIGQCGDAIGIVAAIPVYLSDGEAAVSFAELAERVFAEKPGLAYSLRQHVAQIPPRVFENLDITPHLARADSLTVIEPQDPGLLGRLDGTFRAEQEQWIKHYEDLYARLKNKGPLDRAKAEQDYTDFVQQEIGNLSELVARRRALMFAFESKNAEGVYNNVTALGKAGLLADILALGSPDENEPALARYALKIFDNHEDALRIHDALVMGGATPAYDLLVARSFRADNPLAPEVLQPYLAEMQKKPGQLEKLLTRPDENGLPPLAKAFKKATMLPAFMAQTPKPLHQAALLYKTAEATQDPALARALREDAHKRAGQPLMALSEDHHIRPAAIYNAYAKEDRLFGSIGTRQLDNRQDIQSVNALCHMLRAQPGFTTLDNLILNVNDLRLMSVAQNDGKFSSLRLYGLRGSENFRASCESATNFFAAASRDPKFLLLDKHLLNLEQADRFTLVQNGNANLLYLDLRNREERIALDGQPRDKTALFEDLAKRPNHLLLPNGKVIYNLDRLSRVRFDKEGNSVNVRYFAGQKHQSYVAKTDDCDALREKLLACGFIGIGDRNLVNPDLASLTALETDSSRRPYLRIALDGVDHKILLDKADGQAVLNALHAHGSWIARNQKTGATAIRADALSSINYREGLFYSTLHDTEWRSKFDVSEAEAALHSLIKKHGFIGADSRSAFHPARSDIYSYERRENRFSFFTGNSRRTVPCTPERYDEIIAAVKQYLGEQTRGPGQKPPRAYRENPSPR